MSRQPSRAGAVIVALLAALTFLGGCARQSASQAHASAAEPKSDARPVAGSLREVHVALELKLRSADDARAALARLGDVARAGGGFVQIASFGADETRSQLVLRVPPSALAPVRAACGELGSLARDEETETDVTDAIADLDARLRAGRTEETRLLALIAERTGSVADVLAAERALADVRDRIERLDAQSRASHGRVDLATVDIALIHPALGRSESSLGGELSTAARDGLRAAGEVALGLATFGLRVGPSAAIAALLLATVMAGVRRWRQRHPG